jgi:5-methylcytosine-specific restriction protein A
MTPMRAKTVCAAPGCSQLVDRGRCDAHRKAVWREYEQRRPARDKAFYSSPAWRKVRAYVLSIEPLCRECARADRVTVATEVDHTVPVKDGGAPLDPANLAPLCVSSRKTMAESREAGKLARW